MGGLTNVVIYDSVLFQRGHMIRRWAEALERRFTANATALAPRNKRANKSHWYEAYPPGSLAESIDGQTSKIGPKHIQVLISINVPYAVYVVNDTDTIFPTFAEKLRLPFNPGFSPSSFDFDEESGVTGSFHRSVRGYSGNDFMWRAHQATARRHPSLRGHSGAAFKAF